MIRLILAALILGALVVYVLERTSFGERVGETSDRVFEEDGEGEVRTYDEAVERAENAAERAEERGDAQHESYN